MAAVCAACSNPLVIDIESVFNGEDGMPNDASSGASSQTVPDDVHLSCGDHFHWQCLVDAYSVNSCPHCSANLTSPDPATPGKLRILCNLHNEGGRQEQEDIMPQLSEEGYLKAYPEERRARAFLEFCRQGDLEATLDVLQDDDEEDDLATDVLRYQDQLSEMQSTLQAAILGGNQDIAWLLLYLASDLPLDQFPSDLVQQAQTIGLHRGDTVGKADVRALKDLSGRTAEQIASEVGGPWRGWIGNGRLAV